MVNIDSEHSLGIREFSYGKFWKNGLILFGLIFIYCGFKGGLRRRGALLECRAFLYDFICISSHKLDRGYLLGYYKVMSLFSS